jgi:hypothetical protein
VISDGLACFDAAADSSAHRRIVTERGKASAHHPVFRAVNIVLTDLKIALTGTYHAVKFEIYGHRYVGEFHFRLIKCKEMQHMAWDTLQVMLGSQSTGAASLRRR